MLHCSCPSCRVLGGHSLLFGDWVVGGGAMIGFSSWCLAAFPLIFLFAAFIHRWQFINSECFTMISASRAKQLYDFLPLFDRYLALSHMHHCSDYFCPVYVYILYLIYIFAITLEIYLPRNVVWKVHGKKPNNFIKLLNKLSVNPFLPGYSKGRGARREILLAFIGSVAQLQTMKRNMICEGKSPCVSPVGNRFT